MDDTLADESGIDTFCCVKIRLNGPANSIHRLCIFNKSSSFLTSVARN